MPIGNRYRAEGLRNACELYLSRGVIFKCKYGKRDQAFIPYVYSCHAYWTKHKEEYERGDKIIVKLLDRVIKKFKEGSRK